MWRAMVRCVHTVCLLRSSPDIPPKNRPKNERPSSSSSAAAALEDELEDELQRDRYNVRRGSLQRAEGIATTCGLSLASPCVLRLGVAVVARHGAARRRFAHGSLHHAERTAATYLEDELEDGLGCSPNIS